MMKAVLSAFVLFAVSVVPSLAEAGGSTKGSSDSAVCVGFGPQTPRDIDQPAGTNPVVFPMAPAAERMNLCNIHFHKGAENRAAAFSVPLPLTSNGESGGFACQIASNLSAQERAPFAGNACKGVEPGDTIEMHWVHSSCDVAPGPGLGSCLSEKCANPSLRVETKVFTVVNDPNAHDFGKFAASVERGGYAQASSLPTGTGDPVQFLGSTTGPSYDQAVCSPLQVTWSVRPQCAKVSIQSLSRWCADNVFKEDHGHGVRFLVTEPTLLSQISK